MGDIYFGGITQESVKKGIQFEIIDPAGKKTPMEVTNIIYDDEDPAGKKIKGFAYKSREDLIGTGYYFFDAPSSFTILRKGKH